MTAHDPVEHYMSVSKRCHECGRTLEGVPFNEIMHSVWVTAENSGWHDSTRSVGDLLALVHSEVSEAL